MFNNLFNSAKLVAFNTVVSVMGEPAVWETDPAAPGRLEVAGEGLFKDPTGKEQFVGPAARSQGAEYNSALPVFRYRVGQFPGLFEAVRAGVAQRLRLNDGRRFLVTEFNKKFDGDTYEALLEPLKPRS